MYSKFSTFSYKMGGMSSNNSDKFLPSEKDLESMEFNFLVRPTLEFLDGSHVAHSEDGDNQAAHDQDQEQVEKQVQEEVREEEINVHAEEREILENYASLKIKIPSSLGEFKKNDEEEEDGFRTPTSLDQRIPLIIPTCPPAPRKPKTLPSTKRKAPHHRKILLDMSYEIQSLFPSAILSDLGGKLKKARELGT